MAWESCVSDLSSFRLTTFRYGRSISWKAVFSAGAIGFSTGRSDNHRTSEGKDTPAANAGNDELTGLAQAFEGLSHGVVQIVLGIDSAKGRSFQAK